MDVAQGAVFAPGRQPPAQVVVAGGVGGGQVDLVVLVDVEYRLAALGLLDAVAVAVVDEAGRAVAGYAQRAVLGYAYSQSSTTGLSEIPLHLLSIISFARRFEIKISLNPPYPPLPNHSFVN